MNSLSDAIAEHRTASIRLQPAAVVLALLVLVFSVTAGYGWLGESHDYSEYLNAYRNIDPRNPFFGSRLEHGYAFAAWICKFYLGMDFQFYFTLLAATSLALKFRLFWKYTSTPVVAAVVYLMFLFPLHEYTQIRAAVAVAFAFTAIDQYLEGKRMAAVALFVVAILFHTSAVALLAGGLLVLLASELPPAIAALLFVTVAFVASLATARLEFSLAEVNPLALGYINKAFLHHAVSLFSGENILLFVTTLCGAIFLRPWQRRPDGYFFFLSFWALISLFAFRAIPVFAHRIMELFIFSYFLFAFRFDKSILSRVPAMMMVLTGAWMLYEAIIQQLIIL